MWPVHWLCTLMLKLMFSKRIWKQFTLDGARIGFVSLSEPTWSPVALLLHLLPLRIPHHFHKCFFFRRIVFSQRYFDVLKILNYAYPVLCLPHVVFLLVHNSGGRKSLVNTLVEEKIVGVTDVGWIFRVERWLWRYGFKLRCRISMELWIWMQRGWYDNGHDKSVSDFFLSWTMLQWGTGIDILHLEGHPVEDTTNWNCGCHLGQYDWWYYLILCHISSALSVSFSRTRKGNRSRRRSASRTKAELLQLR